MASENHQVNAPPKPPHRGGRFTWIIAMGKLAIPILLFLCSIFLVVGSFQLFEGTAEGLLGKSESPFLGFFIGMLATALLQSSSTTTSSIVALVAAQKIGLVTALPMIMGANVGTAITSTIVALGHIGNTREYSRAISAASLHDFFNVITAVTLFSFEYFFGFLSNASIYLSKTVNFQEFTMLKGAFFFLNDSIQYIIGLTATPQFPLGNPFICFPIGLLGLFLAIRFFSNTLKSMVTGRIQTNLNKYFFRFPSQSLFWGFLTTSAVQSSSITTSLIVPLVATGKVQLKNAFPFIMGANIGTTTTALFAAIFIGSKMLPDPSAALAIAFAHFLFNLIGVLLIFPFARVRNLLVTLAEKLGYLCLRNRLYGFAYIVGFFFVLPGLLIVLFG